MRARPCSPVGSETVEAHSVVSPDWTDHGRVHCELGSVEKRQAISDLKAAIVNPKSRKEVEILDPMSVHTLAPAFRQTRAQLSRR